MLLRGNIYSEHSQHNYSCISLSRTLKSQYRNRSIKDITSSALWKHHLNLLLQSFRSLSSKESSSVLTMLITIIFIISTDEDPSLTDRKLCNNKFTCCFHKAILVLYSHANAQRTCKRYCLTAGLISNVEIINMWKFKPGKIYHQL